LEGYPIGEDPETGLFAYRLGYCECGCNKPIGIRTVDLREVLSHFKLALDEYELWKSKLRKPKVPLRHRIIKLLGGKIED